MSYYEPDNGGSDAPLLCLLGIVVVAFLVWATINLGWIVLVLYLIIAGGMLAWWMGGGV